MSRPLRIEFPGAIYHVTSRGNPDALQAARECRTLSGLSLTFWAAASGMAATAKILAAASAAGIPATAL